MNLIEQTPLSEALGESAADLGGTPGTEELLHTARIDCSFNGVNLTGAAPTPKIPAQTVDKGFSELLRPASKPPTPSSLS
jgi:hypothetical protein